PSRSTLFPYTTLFRSAVVAESLGGWTPRLAHRVLGHGDGVSRLDVRRPWRGRGPRLSPPRVRDRTVGGGDQEDVRSVLGPQRVRESGRREDVQIPGQHAAHPRAGEAPRSGRAETLAARHPLPPSGRVLGGAPERGGACARALQPPVPGSRPLRMAPGAGPRCAASVPSPLRGGDGRRLQYASGARRPVRSCTRAV